jgi:hypothetical protein
MRSHYDGMPWILLVFSNDLLVKVPEAVRGQHLTSQLDRTTVNAALVSHKQQ